MDRVHEETVKVLEMLLNNVDASGDISTHTWYKGVSDDIKNAIRVSIDTIKSIDKLYVRMIDLYAWIENEKKDLNGEENIVVGTEELMYNIIMRYINEAFQYDEAKEDDTGSSQEDV